MLKSPTICRKPNTATALSSYFLLPAVIFLFFPAVVYHGNSSFIDSPFAFILVALLLLSLAFGAIFWIASLWFEDKARRIYSNSLAVLGIIAWFTGNFLMYSRGLLNGKDLLRPDPVLYQRGELLGLSIAFFLLLFAAWKFPKIFDKGIMLLNFWVVGMLIITIARDKKSYAIPENLSSVYHVSTKKNVFVFLFDTFQSDLFEDIVTSDPILQEKLEGFTYFSKTAGVAPTTYLSLPAIHSGMEYSPTISLTQYYDRGIRKSSFLTKLSAAGYDTVTIGSIGACPIGSRCLSTDQIFLGNWKSIWKDAFFLTDFSLFRAVPSILKQSVYRKGKWLTINIFFARSRAIENNQLLKEMARRFTPASDKPSARFFHLYNTHPPADVDSSCRPTDKTPWNRKSAIDQDSCAIHLFAALMESFKERGIYDNSLIVVLADHGAGFPRPLVPAVLANANPLLMIKPFRSHEKFRTSKAPASLLDVANTVCSLTEDCKIDNGFSLFDTPNFNGRNITFNDYVWKSEYWSNNFVPLRNRYSIIGPVDEILSWYKQVGPERLKASYLTFSPSDAQEAFDFGWWMIEKNKGRSMRWAIGRYAQLYLAIPPNRDATLSILVSTHQRNKKQKMVLYLDDKLIGESPVQPAILQTLTFRIPGDAVVHPVSRITFLFDQYNSVRMQPRPLAVAFYRLDVLPGEKE